MDTLATSLLPKRPLFAQARKEEAISHTHPWLSSNLTWLVCRPGKYMQYSTQARGKHQLAKRPASIRGPGDDATLSRLGRYGVASEPLQLGPGVALWPLSLFYGRRFRHMSKKKAGHPPHTQYLYNWLLSTPYSALAIENLGRFH